MPFTPLFSLQQVNTAPSVISWADDSTGSDPAIAKKRIFLQLTSGSYLVPAGTETAYVETTEDALDLNVLEEDKALNVTVQWLDENDEVLYDEEALYCFSLYAEQYLFDLTKAQAANPKLLMDGDFWHNKEKLSCLVESAQNAISLGADINAAQLLLDKAGEMLNSQIFFF